MTYSISKYDCPTEVTLAPIWPYVGGVTCHLFGVASTVTTILGAMVMAVFPFNRQWRGSGITRRVGIIWAVNTGSPS
jgi:hypothetical protein